MIRLRFLTTSVAVLAMLAGVTIHATTVVALSNRALTENASVIATGRCVDLRTTWEGRILVTVATISITDVLKGEPGQTITIALPGGADANRKFPVAMTYAGAPQIAINEEVFVFLAPQDGITSGLTVAGFSQGKFSIVNDERGEKVVSRNLSGITLQSPAGTRRGVATRVPLDDFKDEIKSYLSKQ